MIALLAILANGLREMTDGQFADLLAALRRELAPTTALEGVYVERALTFVGRMRKAAQLEEAGGPLTSIWLRYEAMAERGFWRALAALDKGRKPQGKARDKAPKIAVEVASGATSGGQDSSSLLGMRGPTPPGSEAEPRPPDAPATAAPIPALKPAPAPAPKPASALAPAPKPASLAPKPAPAPAGSKRPEPKFLKKVGKLRPPQMPKLPPFPPALPGGDLLHLSITSKPPKHRVDDHPMPFEI